MLSASQRRLLARLGADDLVLDVGGWAKPLARADWVLDLLPYETRGLYDYDRDANEPKERFTADTWVARDICDREPWPFKDTQFDFAVCSHTLEDVRDPIWVCRELQRVARAGYIEVPSRLEEQAFGIQGPWTGWGHHHWLVDVHTDGLDFIFKHRVIDARQDMQFSAAFAAELTAEERVQTLWWEGSFSVREKVLLTAEEARPVLQAPVAVRSAQGGDHLSRPAPGRWWSKHNRDQHGSPG